MKRPLLIFVASLAIASCGAPNRSTTKGSQIPTPSPSLASTAPSPSPPVPTGFVYITFSSEQAPINWPQDLWYFDFRTGRSKRLTKNDGFKYRPRLRNADALDYIENGTLYEVSISKRSRRVVLRDDGMQAFAWSPSGSDLAYASLKEIKIAPHGSQASVIRRLPRYEGGGRGGRDDDEQYVAWSPNGTSLLVQQTQMCCTDPGDEARSLFVIGLDGKDVVPPMKATFSRWSPDGRRIYAREFDTRGHGDYRGRLFSLDVTTGVVRFLSVRRDTFNLAVSPDGAHLAYDGGGFDPSTYLFDLDSGKERRLASGVLPLWIDSTHLIVTNVRKCANTGDDICGGEAGIPWHPTGTSSIISLADDEPRVLRAHWTYDAALVVPPSS